MFVSPAVLFGSITFLYLLPVFVAHRRGMNGSAQLFIIVCLLVSMLAMFPPALVLLSTPMTTFALAAAGSSIILPGWLWFAAFAAACLVKPRHA